MGTRRGRFDVKAAIKTHVADSTPSMTIPTVWGVGAITMKYHVRPNTHLWIWAANGGSGGPVVDAVVEVK
jgi:hypothetical protein